MDAWQHGDRCCHGGGNDRWIYSDTDGVNMKGKKKEKAASRRSQRRAARDSARRRMDRQVKAQMDKLRHAVQTGRGGVASVNMGGGIGPIRELGDEVDIAKCDGVGHCCIDTMVPIDPGDVWNIMHSPEVQDTFGVEVTSDLSKSPEERGLIYYWLDPRTGAPRASLRQDESEDGKRRCVMLKEIEEDGEISYSCLMGDDRPTVCLANPIGRVGKKNDKGRLAGWGYVVQDDPCAECPKGCEQESVVVEDHLKGRGMEERYAITDMFHGFVGWLVREVKPEEIRQLAAMLIFDYDRFPMEAGGLSKEQVFDNRPESVENLLVGAKMIVEGVLRGNPQSTSMEKVDAETEEAPGEAPADEGSVEPG